MVKDIADSLRLVFIYDDLFIDDFISVGDTAADKVAFFPALVLSAFYLLGKLCGIIFGNADHDVFEDDAVQILRAVYILRCSLRCGDKNFPVLLKPLFVNGDFNGISSEPVEGIDENDLPFLRGIAVREHPLKLRPVVVGAGHGTVYIRSHNAQPVTLRKFVADAELSFYGLLGLPLAAISRVDHG